MTAEFRTVNVKTWYLEYDGKLPHKVASSNLFHWKNPSNGDYLELYQKVGKSWGWTGRLLLNAKDLKQVLGSSKNEIWLFKIEDEVRGFFEIDFSVHGKAEIVYFGLLPEEIGKGYGKLFLDSAISTAGRKGHRVWLHTCEYDHPKALLVYQKAGFKIVSENVSEEIYPIAFLDKHKESRIE